MHVFCRPLALSFLSAVSYFSPEQPLRAWIRALGSKLRPSQPVPFHPICSRARDELLAGGAVGLHQAATILYEQGQGRVPTIVFGGFIPDATEQVYLLRRFLLKQGSVYYFNYPQLGFSLDLLFAQLDDLVEELTALHGQLPVIFSVSFGAGIVMEWLKRTRLAGGPLGLGGIVFISPVTCVEDLLATGDAKPTTLLGRALKPYLQPGCSMDHKQIEKTRTIFTRMFEAGAKNTAPLRVLLTARDLRRLYTAVMGTINAIDLTGACERLRALKEMSAPATCCPQLLPLSQAPTLVLYSENESSVLAEHSPTRAMLAAAGNPYFPDCRNLLISNRNGTPVQHASLIFHCFNFLPAITDFYHLCKSSRCLQAA